MAVRKVAAVRQVHPEDRVSRFAQREVHGHVRLRAGVRLRARDRRALDDVDVFTPSVVAAAWIAFGVLVGEYGAGRLENSAAHEVLRRDELEAVVLAVPLVADGLRHVRIDLGERTPDGWLGFGG